MTIATDDLEELKDQLNRSFIAGADFIEIRFDFLSPDNIRKALNLVAGLEKKAIFTLRHSNQGGFFKGSELDRTRWLKELATHSPMLLDIELDTIKRDENLADYLEHQRTRILVSWHDFEKTPSTDVLIDILGEIRIYSNFAKVVTNARDVDDALRMLDLYENALDLNLVAFAMGEAGVISRVLCTLYNAPFTYAGLDRAAAPGQLTLDQMRTLYLRINQNQPCDTRS